MCTGKAFELSPFSFTGETFLPGALDPDSSYFSVIRQLELRRECQC